MNSRRHVASALLAAALFAISAQAQTPRVAVDYTVSVKRPVSHIYDIEMEISGIRSTSIDVAMPAWSPGEYRIRDFARNVQEFSAETAKNARLTWQRTDKQTWRVAKPAGDDVRIRYRLYSSDLIDEMADITSAATFMYVVGNKESPLRVKFDIPSNWKVYGSLEKNGDRYIAANYDVLADTPVFLGDFKVLEFTSSTGVGYRIVFTKVKLEVTDRQVIEDLRDLVNSAASLFGPAPYKNYTFLVKVRGSVSGTESFEHFNSARMTVGENDFVAQASYRRFVAGESRALVRAWIGRKIHPASLSPIDSSRESYSKLLWFMDGASSYYANLLTVRAGILIPEEYYSKMGGDIDALQHQAGRQIMNLEDASMNVWTRSDNTAINTFSYAGKGEIASFLLDLEIRGRTKNQKSLNDVVSYLLSNYAAKETGVPEDGIENAVASVAGSGFTPFFDKVIRSTSELDYNSTFQYAGLRVDIQHIDSAIYFGVEWERAENNQVRVRRVIAGSPAERAQLDAGDVVIALDSERVTSDNLVSRLHSRRIGVGVNVTLMRGERLLTTQLTPGETREDTTTFGEMTGANPEQVRLRNAWLGM